MLGVLRGGLPPSSLVTDHTLHFLVLQVKLGQFALAGAEPAVDHDLGVVQSTNFLHLFQLAMLLNIFRIWTACDEERLGSGGVVSHGGLRLLKNTV